MKSRSLHRCRRPKSRSIPPGSAPGESCSALSKGERWLFGLLIAASAMALVQQVATARHFAARVPEIAEMVRHWFANVV
ncbi:MAG: hypothetical protein U1G08_17485 [Verrucomicrobiota bacterium]